MKKLLSSALVLFLMLTTISCTDDDAAIVPAIPSIGADGFTWIDSSGATVQTVNNPYASTQYKSIFAVSSGATIYEINLTSIAVGTYSLTASGNALYYKNASMSAPFSPTLGTIIITANANNKLSGTFTATGTGGGITTLTGQFKNIVVNP